MENTLEIEVTADLSRLEKKLKGASNEITQFARKAEKNLTIDPKFNEEAIRKELEDVKIIARDTGKELDKAMKSRFVELSVKADRFKNEIKRLEDLKKRLSTPAELRVDAKILAAEKKIKDLADKKESLKQSTKIVVTAETARATKEIEELVFAKRDASKEEKAKINVDISEARAELSAFKAEKTKDTSDEVIKIDIESKAARKELKSLKKEKDGVTKPSTAKIQLKVDDFKSNLVEVNRGLLNLRNTGEDVTSRLKTKFGSLSKSLRTGLLSTFGAFSIAGGIAAGLRGISRFLGDSVKAAIEFESAFIGVKKTVNATAFELNVFQKELEDLSKTIPLTFEELSKIAELGGQMGVGIDDLKIFTETVAQIGVTTNLTSEEAALAFSRISNVLGLPLENVDKLASSVVALGNNFAAQESEIVNFTQRIAGAGHISNLTVGDITGISTAFTSVGIQAEKGGSSVNKALLKINDAVIRGGDDLDRFAKVAGLSADEFKNKWKKDAGSAFTLFVEGLGESGDSANAIISDLIGNTSKVKEAFLNLAGAGDLLRRSMLLGNSAYNENNALQREAALRFGSTKSQLQLLTNEMELQKKEIGESLLPAVLKLKKGRLNVQSGVASAVEAFDRLSSSGKTLMSVLGAGGLVGILSLISGPLAIIVGGVALFTTIVSRASSAMSKLGDESATAKDKMLGISDQMIDIEDQLDKLTNAYVSGKISMKEYEKQTAGLKDEQAKLADSYDKILDRQQQIANADKKKAKANNSIKKSISERRKEEDKLADAEARQILLQTDLQRKLDAGEITQSEYNKSIATATKIYEDQKIKTSDAIDSSKKIVEAKANEIALWDFLTNSVEGSTEAQEIFDSITLDGDGASAEILKVANAHGINAQKAIDDAKAQIKALQAMQALMGASTEGGSMLEKFIGKVGNILPTSGLIKSKKAVENLDKKILELENTIRVGSGLADGSFGLEGLKIVNESEIKDFLSEVKGGTRKILNEEGALSKELGEVNDKISMSVDGSQEQADLLEYQKKLVTQLNALEDPDVGPGNPKRTSAIEKQTELIKAMAYADMIAIKNSKDAEIDKARQIVAINEDMQRKLNALKGNSSKNFLEDANEIIKKRNEQKETGVKAYNDIGSSIEDVVSSLAELKDEISDVNDKISDVNADAVKDIQERYVEIGDDIRDNADEIIALNREIEDTVSTSGSLEDQRKEVSGHISDSEKAIGGYQKSIEGIIGKTEDLNTTTEEGIAKRYVEIGHELDTANGKLDVLNAKTTLTTEEAQKKADLEAEILKLQQEQALASGNITQADIDKATTIDTESQTERLLRQRDEKKAIYDQELADLETKLAEENQKISGYLTKEANLRSVLDQREIDDQRKKLAVLQEDLRIAYEERAALQKEQAQAEANLTDAQKQEARDNQKKTEIENILEDRDIKLKALNDELTDLKTQQDEKIALLKDYYYNAIVLRKEYLDKFGEKLKFEDIDLEKFKKDLESVNISDVQLQGFKKDQEKVSGQDDAVNKLEEVAKLFEKVNVESNDNIGVLKRILGQVIDLKVAATPKLDAQGQTNNDYTRIVNMKNNYNIDGLVTAESVARAITRALKL